MNDVLIRLTGMWENTTKDGRTYYSGVLGGVKVLLFKDKNPAEGAPPWSLMIAPRPEKPAAEPKPAPRPQSARPKVDPELDDSPWLG
jgi:hypothetical protein